VISGHIGGLPIEETVLQFVPTAAVVVTALAVAGRFRVRRMRDQLWRR
jgi:flagellar biosynthesis protein FliQ